MDDLQSKIRERAYQLWEQEGRQHGRDVEYWLQAERSLAAAPEPPEPSRRVGGSGARKGSGRTRKGGGTPARSR